MNSEIIKSKLSESITKTNQKEETKQNRRNARKNYINSLPDKSILSKHMNTPECHEKSKIGWNNYIINNPEKMKERGIKIAKTNKENNKKLTKEERQQKYSRGNGKNNPKWKGYFILIKNDEKIIFETRLDLTRDSKYNFGTVSRHITNKLPFKHGKYKGYYVINTKELL